MQEQSIFIGALEKEDPAERTAFLNEACAKDPALRERIEKLLERHQQAGGFLQPPDADQYATVEGPKLSDAPGMVIGPYKLLQQIGEGGMGTVYMAEQTEPVRRMVALKLIKEGMDSRQIIARFEAERQALALMDHPNIAKVFDGGTVPFANDDFRFSIEGEEGRKLAIENQKTAIKNTLGRPYFVMELVKGLPITKYCDEHHLTPRQRLELFVPVCQAVQHAHQKGIIHRDLKPSNVLVAQYDGKPVPKVIDFGVAKAAGPKLTDMTLFTELGAVVGTFEYMSPEQAELNQLDVDTRSDIYSLGVLLYELLTGTTPLERGRVKQAALLEVLRLIREEEPPRPSLRLSDLGRSDLPSLANPATVPAHKLGPTSSLASISALRQTEPAKLTKLMRGELDWIVMRALDKDRNRRYETANGFAMDVQRYLADEPVQACPPSAVYRLRKFARRKKTALAVAACVFLALAGIAGSIGWAVRDKGARDEEIERDRAARQREAETKAVEMLDAAEPRLRDGQPGDPALGSAAQRVEALLDNDGLGPEIRQRAEQLRRDVHALADLDDIRLRQAESKNGTMFDSAGANKRYAEAFLAYGIDAAAQEPPQAAARVRVSAVREALLAGLDAWMQLKTAQDPVRTWLQAVADEADDSAWRRSFRGAALAGDTKHLQALAGQEEALLQRPSVLAWLGSVLDAAGLRKEAEVILRNAQHRYPGDFWTNYNLGHFFIFGPPPLHPDEAVGYFRAAVAIRPSSAEARSILGLALLGKGDADGAIAAYRQAIGLDPGFAIAYENFGNALRDQGNLDGAVASFKKAIELDPKFAAAHASLGDCYAQLGCWEKAAAASDLSLELDPTNYDRWCLSATLHAALGDRHGYRRTCRGMLERFGHTTRAQQAERMAKACLLLPGALNGPDSELAQELAQRAVDGGEKSRLYYWFAMAKGLADYRAGHYSEAIRSLERSPLPAHVDGTHWEATKFALLAIALDGLGRNEDARASLAKAERILMKMPDPDKGQPLAAMDWHDWVHARLLWREAEALLKKGAVGRDQESDKKQP